MNDKKYLHHTVLWKRRPYILVDMHQDENSGGLYPFCANWLQTTPISSGLSCGNYSTFQIAESQLVLTRLNILTADGNYPVIDRVEPCFCQEDHTMEYRRLRHRCTFTGTIRIGTGTVINRFEPRNCLTPKSLSELWDLVFDHGVLQQAHDAMPVVAAHIQAQQQANSFCATHALDSKRRAAVDELCAYRETDWAAPLFSVIHPERVLETLEQLKRTLGTPYWFICSYGDSGLSERLSLDYLHRLTVPDTLIRFLEKHLNEAVTEKMVVLEFLETFYRDIAAPYWEDRVIPGHLYTDAGIHTEVTASIRGRLQQVTLERWGQDADGGLIQ